jgi:hypothetical protein
VQKDEQIGAQWLLRAASQGNVVAQNRIAHLLQAGRGIEVDPTEAAKWHMLALKGGVKDDKLETFIGGLPEADRAEARDRADAWRPSKPEKRAAAPAQ